MLIYIGVVVLLVGICSAKEAGDGWRWSPPETDLAKTAGDKWGWTWESPQSHLAKATKSNATYVAIAEELGIEEVTYMQSDSQLYGGAGGSAFDSQGDAVRSISIRSGSLIDSIQLVYSNGQTSEQLGGSGGSLAQIDLHTNENIVAIFGRSGALVDSLTFVTNEGRIFGPYGGDGGSPFQVPECKLSGVFGRSADLIDAIGFHC